MTRNRHAVPTPRRIRSGRTSEKRGPVAGIVGGICGSAATALTLLLVTAACGSTVPTVPAREAPPVGGVAAVAPATAGLATAVTPLGTVVTMDGFTVYRFDKDTANPSKSACAGDCAKAWPPLLGDGTPKLSGVPAEEVGTVGRRRRHPAAHAERLAALPLRQGRRPRRHQGRGRRRHLARGRRRRQTRRGGGTGGQGPGRQGSGGDEGARGPAVPGPGRAPGRGLQLRLLTRSHTHWPRHTGSDLCAVAARCVTSDERAGQAGRVRSDWRAIVAAARRTPQTWVFGTTSARNP